MALSSTVFAQYIMGQTDRQGRNNSLSYATHRRAKKTQYAVRRTRKACRGFFSQVNFTDRSTMTRYERTTDWKLLTYEALLYQASTTGRRERKNTWLLAGSHVLAAILSDTIVYSISIQNVSIIIVTRHRGALLNHSFPPTVNTAFLPIHPQTWQISVW